MHHTSGAPSPRNVLGFQSRQVIYGHSNIIREVILEATRTVPTPAHTSTAAVASFRTWRDSQFRVARGPAQATIERGRMVSIKKPF